jgi:hypothetical protein
MARTYIRFMGQNRRYGSDITWQTIAGSLLRSQAVSLSQAEIGEDIVEANKPIAVEAWVRFETPSTPVRIEGVAVAWTRRAVQLEYALPDGTARRVWVHASAVDRR